MYRDAFGEPTSHSNPKGGIEEFDTLMWSSGADQSRKRTLAAANSKIHYVDTSEVKAIAGQLEIVSGHIGAPAKNIVSSHAVQKAIAVILSYGKHFTMIEQYSNIPNAPLNQIHTQGPNEVFYLI